MLQTHGPGRTKADRRAWFQDARLGLFCHYGLYSLLGRGEWVRNREYIDHATYNALAQRFTAEHFDAGQLADLALTLGARYLTFTTKHHEGFCHFDSKLTDFKSTRSPAKRDLVAEVVDACRKRGLGVSLYFSLNDWHHQPDATDALESDAAHGAFIDYVHGQVREVLAYGPDILWYDGWWPFDAEGWRSEALDAMTQEAGVLTNNRHCLPGDFGTPEQHVLALDRMWEACVTLNDHWGYCTHDDNWKTPRQVVDMLILAARGGGNLLLNVGPRGDGTIPEPSVRILEKVGAWVQANEEALRPGVIAPAMDWNPFSSAAFSARPGTTYLHLTTWPGESLTLCGVRGRVRAARFVHSRQPIEFEQVDDRLRLLNLPQAQRQPIATVIALDHDGDLSSYQTGGMRVPRGVHPQYDPVPTDHSQVG